MEDLSKIKTQDLGPEINSKENPLENNPEENKEVQDILSQELDIEPGDREEAVEKKVEAALDSPSFLEKIRQNKFLGKAFKIMILAFALMKVEPLAAQELPARDKQEQFDNKQAEKNNRALLGGKEYVAPEKVMIAYGEIVDPNMMGVPAGGFFKKDFLNSPAKKEAFAKKLADLGYSSEQANSLIEEFKGGNIVFNEKELKKGEFRDVLAHERMHKEITNLPAEEKKKLDEARDIILDDFRTKEQEWSEKSDKLYASLQKGLISEEEYNAQSKAEIKRANPTLLDNTGQTDGLIPVLRNAEEFYTYLMMNKFHPRVISYLQVNCPEAYRIFQSLKENIYLHIIEQEKKINK